MQTDRRETMSGAIQKAPLRVDPMVFATDDLPPRQRLDAWNAYFETLNAISVAEPDRRSLSTRSENWLLGPMLFSVNRVTRASFERSRNYARRDGLDHWVVRVLRRGENRMRTETGCYQTRPGQPLLFSLDRAWVSEWTDAEWISLCVPRDAFPELSAGFAALGIGPQDGPATAFLVDYLSLLEGHLREATPETLPAMAEATRAVLTACLLRDVAPRSIAPEDVARAQFERVRAQLRQRLASPRLDAKRLAVAAGMSRSALYRLFEPHGGVARYIKALRLRLVQASLTDPALASVPIATLAERAGFFDASTFSRAFRAQYGHSPRDARDAALAGLGIAANRDVAGVLEASYGSLLRRIAVSAGGARGAMP